jgi:hypothetical protein
MNDRFDELAKSMAQSTTRRGALKKFGLGLAGITLASLGLANDAQAKKPPYVCHCNKPDYGCTGAPDYFACYGTCSSRCQPY